MGSNPTGGTPSQLAEWPADQRLRGQRAILLSVSTTCPRSGSSGAASVRCGAHCSGRTCSPRTGRHPHPGTAARLHRCRSAPDGRAAVESAPVATERPGSRSGPDACAAAPRAGGRCRPTKARIRGWTPRTPSMRISAAGSSTTSRISSHVSSSPSGLAAGHHPQPARLVRTRPALLLPGQGATPGGAGRLCRSRVRSDDHLTVCTVHLVRAGHSSPTWVGFRVPSWSRSRTGRRRCGRWPSRIWETTRG